MKVLIIGGTGTISTEVTKLAVKQGIDVTLLNRGNHQLFDNVKTIIADINDEAAATKALAGYEFDTVINFIVFHPEQAQRDIRLFSGKTKQYIFISSASCYQKPPVSPCIDENTPLENPFWDYSQNKILCEQVYLKAYQNQGFPVTIVRPSHTYCKKSVPVAIHGNGGSYTVLKRMLEGKPVIIHGDGSSIWAVTHACDFAKGFVGLIGKAVTIGEAYGITSNELLTWDNIHKIIAEALGVQYKPYYISSYFLSAISPSLKSPLLGDKTNSVIFDNTKIKKIVPDFEATIKFKQGAKEAIEYMLSHPECQTYDADFDKWCDRVISAVEKAKNELI